MTKFGIIGAMEVEVELLIEHMNDTHVRKAAGLSFYEGKIAGQDVVVVRCGVGKVNAALCTQALIDLFHVDVVINTGIAGSLSNTLDIGDFVISCKTLQHDVDVSALGYEPACIPGSNSVFVESDPCWCKSIYSHACTQDASYASYTGVVATGDQFVADGSRKTWIAQQWNALCCEMEGGSIAQVASANQLPFVIVRAISDKADGSAEVDYPSFEAMTARRSASLLVSWLTRLASS